MKTFENYLKEQAPDTWKILSKEDKFLVFAFWAEDYARTLVKNLKVN